MKKRYSLEASGAGNSMLAFYLVTEFIKAFRFGRWLK
jgi:hypothetical protein